MQETNSRQLRTIEYWLVLCAICMVSVFYYGIRAAAVLGLAAVTAVLTDFICLFLRDKAYKAADLSNVGTALILALMFPATIPYSVVILSTIFAVTIGTHVFGARRDMLFPPAAVGYLFAVLSWKEEVLAFPKAGSALALFGNADAARYASVSHVFNTEGKLSADAFDLMLGVVCGPMGAGCLLLLVVGMVVLSSRRGISVLSILGFLTGTVLYCYVTGIYPWQACAVNMNVFAMLFLVADTAVLPKGFLAHWASGLFTALLSQYLTHVYDLEYAVVIAVILSCPVWHALGAAEAKYTAWYAKRKAAVSAENAENTEQSEETEVTA